MHRPYGESGSPEVHLIAGIGLIPRTASMRCGLAARVDPWRFSPHLIGKDHAIVGRRQGIAAIRATTHRNIALRYCDVPAKPCAA
jgi:hypothetical protein